LSAAPGRIDYGYQAGVASPQRIPPSGFELVVPPGAYRLVALMNGFEFRVDEFHAYPDRLVEVTLPELLEYSGRVVATGDGPIRHARVSLQGIRPDVKQEWRAEVWTDGAGQFKLAMLAGDSSRVLLSVRHWPSIAAQPEGCDPLYYPRWEGAGVDLPSEITLEQAPVIVSVPNHDPELMDDLRLSIQLNGARPILLSEPGSKQILRQRVFLPVGQLVLTANSSHGRKYTSGPIKLSTGALSYIELVEK
jgi:hypothetical protein